MSERNPDPGGDAAVVEATTVPSIDEVLVDTRQRERRAAGAGAAEDAPRPSSSALMLGEVLEERSSDRPDRVLVRWRDERGGRHERWVRSACGLALEPGDTVLLGKPANWNGWVVTGALQGRADRAPARAAAAQAPSSRLEAHVDGERVEIEGHDEVVLRCGEASITLRRDGRVAIRGTRVETEALGTNRVKGGIVEIN